MEAEAEEVAVATVVVEVAAVAVEAGLAATLHLLVALVAGNPPDQRSMDSRRLWFVSCLCSINKIQ